MIMNMNQLFDKLQEYIDTKVGQIEFNLRELFEEYGLNEILPYLNEIKTVADNIEILQPIGENITGLVEIIDNMEEILNADEYALLAKDSAAFANQSAHKALEHRYQAWEWAQQNYNIPVDDDQHTGFSAYHWALVSKYESQGTTLRGLWNPNSGSYPTPNESGDFWIVEDYGEFDNIYWYIGDHLIWLDDGTTSDFYRIPNIVDWASIQNKPELYTPKPHYHRDYVHRSLFTDKSTGSPTAGYAVKLNHEGMVDNSMIKLPIVYLVGPWTPTPNEECPDTTEHTPGAVWIISGTAPYGYMFTGCGLSGQHVDDGDYLMWVEDGWFIRKDDIVPTDFYKRDGAYPITADFQAAGHKLVNIAEGSTNGDAVEYGQFIDKLTDYYKKAEFISISQGSSDKFKPVLLNYNGMIDPSMVAFTSLNPIGVWDPTTVAGEYPDESLYEPGDYWQITGVDPDLGYTFTGGDLSGRVCYNGNFLILMQESWGLRDDSLTPSEYLKLDGSSQMLGNLNLGNFKAIQMDDPVENTDGVNLRYLSNNYSSISHTHDHSTIDDGSGSLLDADLLDGYEGASYYHSDLNPIGPADIQGQGHTPDSTGINADMLDDKHASEFYSADNPLSWDDVSNKPSEFPPTTASQDDIGGIKIWTVGDTLYISTQ